MGIYAPERAAWDYGRKQRAAADARYDIQRIDADRSDLKDLQDRIGEIIKEANEIATGAEWPGTKSEVGHAISALEDACWTIAQQIEALNMDRADHQATIEKAEI